MFRLYIKIFIFCLISLFKACEGMSAIDDFYTKLSCNEKLSIEICHSVIVQVLKNITSLSEQLSLSSELGQVVNSGSDEDCPLTVEDEIDGIIASNMSILQKVNIVLDKYDYQDKNTGMLKSELNKLFEFYSTCLPSGFITKAKETLKKLDK